MPSFFAEMTRATRDELKGCKVRVMSCYSPIPKFCYRFEYGATAPFQDWYLMLLQQTLKEPSICTQKKASVE